MEVPERRSVSGSVKRAVKGRLAGSALLALLAAVLLAPAGLRAAPEEDRRELLGPTPEVMRGPESQAALDRAIAEAEEAERRRQEPAQVAARERSRTKYKGLTDGEARQLAAETFPQLLLEPAFHGLKLPPETELVRYLDTHTALVKTPGSEAAGHGLVESTAPLRAEAESGDLRPVDAELVDRGAYLEPANADVETRLPERLADGIELPESDLKITPEGATQAGPGSVVGDSIQFHSNTDTDTDFFAAPTGSGVETFWQLRSAQSPERLYLDYNLASNERLKETTEGLGAEVRRAGEMIASVSPPVAFDADGTGVPVETEIEGDRLVLDVDHSEGDYKLPIIVDPITEQDDFTYGGGCPSPDDPSWRPYWRWESPYAGAFVGSCESYYGVWTLSRAGWYLAGYYGQWIWQAPTDTYISRIDFGQVINSFGGEGICTLTGIYNPAAYAWQEGSPAAVCADLSYDQSHVTSTTAYNNVAVLQYLMGHDAWRYYEHWHSLQRATFTIHERYNPNVTKAIDQSVPAANRTGWVDDTLGTTSQTYRNAVTATDRGTGVQRLELRAPDPANPTQLLTQTANRGCSGTRGSQSCTQNGGGWSNTFNYRLPEGRNPVVVFARDQVGNAGNFSWHQRIDRSAPAFQTSGSLKSAAQAGQPLTGESYDLQVAAQDGSLTTDSTQRSGVKSIEVLVDGERVAFSSNDPQMCASSCPLDLTWRMYPAAFGLGSHTVSVLVKDQVGHQAPVQTLTVNVQDGPDDSAEIVTICAGALVQENHIDELDVAAPTDLVDEIGTREFGSRYVGSWIDRDVCPPEVHAAIKNASAADIANFYLALTLDGRIDVTRVTVDSRTYTYADLDSAANGVADLLETYDASPHIVEISIKSQTVTVRARQLTAAQRAAIDAATAPDVVYELDPSFNGIVLDDSRTDYPPYKAGKEARIPERCTTGFTVRRVRDYYGTTAGHCSLQIDDEVRVGSSFGDGVFVGFVDRNRYNGQNPVTADVASYTLENDHATRRIYTGGDLGHRTVTKRFDSHGWSYETSLCFQGATSGAHNCGVIESFISRTDIPVGVDPNGIPKYKTYRDVICFAASDRSDPGDSGGPVYKVRADESAKAAGIVWGHINEDTCFSKIGHVLAELDAVLAMRPD